eukprot:scaffold521_cov167-Amphora_coffeaeformis.AAC.15
MSGSYSDFPRGKCDLGDACKCPDGELRPKYKCCLCGKQLHNIVQGCAVQHGDDDEVECPSGFGCKLDGDVDMEDSAPAANQGMEDDDDEGNNEDQGDDEDQEDDDEAMEGDEKDQEDNEGEKDPDETTPGPSKRGRKRSSTGGGETAVTKRRPILPGSKKRGIPKGSKISSNKKLDDWYHACKAFEEINKTRKMSQAEFLRSEASGDLFSGKVSEQQSFGRYLGKYKNGELKPTAKKRHYPRKYEEIEEKLIKYYDLRSSLYKRDKCGVSWTLFRTKCMEWANQTGHEEFRVTPGWVNDTLRRYDRNDIRWDGDDELPETERDHIMSGWRRELEDLIEDKNLTLEDVYNADQTNFFYQKLPNHLYIDNEAKKKYEGAKTMKDKLSVTLMVCTSASGTKVPLAMAGKEKKPECFRLTEDGKTPPISYTYQSNGWFDRNATLWWITNVFWPHHKRTRGDVPALLLLDKCSAHEVDLTKIPAKLEIKFIPQYLSHRHQPLDMGIISSLRIGYKHNLLRALLKMFDVEGGYELASEQRKKQPKGCKGLYFGSKPHILDVMNILKEIWDEDTRYSREEGIQRCWFKADILPPPWEAEISGGVGSSAMNKGKIPVSEEDVVILCDLIRSIILKVAETNVDTEGIALALKGSFAGEGAISDTSLRSMATNWIDIEDDADIAEAAYMEALEKLDKMDDEVDPYEEESIEMELAQKIMAANNQGPTLVDFYHSMDAVREYGASLGVSADVMLDLDRFAHAIRRRKHSLPAPGGMSTMI